MMLWSVVLDEEEGDVFIVPDSYVKVIDGAKNLVETSWALVSKDKVKCTSAMEKNPDGPLPEWPKYTGTLMASKKSKVEALKKCRKIEASLLNPNEHTRSDIETTDVEKKRKPKSMNRYTPSSSQSVRKESTLPIYPGQDKGFSQRSETSPDHLDDAILSDVSDSAEMPASFNETYTTKQKTASPYKSPKKVVYQQMSPASANCGAKTKNNLLASPSPCSSRRLFDTSFSSDQKTETGVRFCSSSNLTFQKLVVSKLNEINLNMEGMKKEMKELKIQIATNKSAVATSLILESDLIDIPLPLEDVDSFKSFVSRLNSEDKFHKDMMRLLVARSIHIGARPTESNQKRVAIMLKSNILPWLFAPQLLADLSLTKIKCWEGGKHFFKLLIDMINTSKLCSANLSMVEACFGDYCRRKGSEFRRVGKVDIKRKTKSPNKNFQSPKKRPEDGSHSKGSTATSVSDPRTPKRKMGTVKVRRFAIESSCSDEEERSSPMKKKKIRHANKPQVNLSSSDEALA